MEKLLLLIFNLGLSIIYLVGIVGITLLVQLISYRILGFNLYKWLCYNLIDKYLIAR